MTTATTTAETGATSGARAPANINKTPAGPGQPTPHGIANNIADTGAAKGGHGIVAEDAEFLYEDEPQEPNYAKISRALASVTTTEDSGTPAATAEGVIWPQRTCSLFRGDP